MGGRRVRKDHPRIETYGTIDELNALLGLAIVADPPPEIRKNLERLQHLLFHVGAELSTPEGIKPPKTITDDHVKELEEWIDSIEGSLPRQTAFLLPGGSQSGGLLHHARTVCRRAERHATALQAAEPVSPTLIVFLNRLSDFLFLAARASNIAKNAPETPVRYD